MAQATYVLPLIRQAFEFGALLDRLLEILHIIFTGRIRG